MVVGGGLDNPHTRAHTNLHKFKPSPTCVAARERRRAGEGRGQTPAQLSGSFLVGYCDCLFLSSRCGSLQFCYSS